MFAFLFGWLRSKPENKRGLLIAVHCLNVRGAK